jgi:hypothetical protein
MCVGNFLLIFLLMPMLVKRVAAVSIAAFDDQRL